MKMRELIASYSDTKRQNERFDLWLYHVGRRFSWPVAWAAVNLGIAPTTVTFISALFVWAGGALIALGNPTWQLIGALLFQLWIIFDCADGTVARATGRGSKRGEYADAFGGYSVSLLLYSSMGVAAARAVLGLESVVPFIMGLSGFGPWIGGGGSEAAAGAVGTSELGIDGAAAFVAGGELDFLPLSLVLAAAGVLLAGVGASLFSLYARLLYQKFLNVFEDRAKDARPIKPREDKTNPVMIAAQNLAANSGFALPLAFFALATENSSAYVLFYVVVNAGMLLLTMRRTLTKRATAGLEDPGIRLDIAGPGAADHLDDDEDTDDQTITGGMAGDTDGASDHPGSDHRGEEKR